MQNQLSAVSGEKRPRSLVRVRGKGQITLSAAVRRAARLEEDDLVSVEVTDKGILLRPMKMIDAAQAWFWTPKWQEGESEAEEDIRLGRTRRRSSGKALLDSLK